MFLLLPIAPAQGPTHCLFPGVTRVGRAPGMEISLPNEPSVSRAHGEFELVSGVVSFTDQGSSLGTTVGAKKLEPRKKTVVQPGSILRLGEMPTRYILAPSDVVLCSTDLLGTEKTMFESCAAQSGVPVVDRWHDSVTHLVAPRLKAKLTPKTLVALVEGTAIVRLDWLVALSESRRLPAADEFLPMLDDLSGTSEQVSSPGRSARVAALNRRVDVRPNPQRKYLFRGMHVVLSDPGNLLKEADLLARAGAVVHSAAMPAHLPGTNACLLATHRSESPALAGLPVWTRSELMLAILDCALPAALQQLAHTSRAIGTRAREPLTGAREMHEAATPKLAATRLTLDASFGVTPKAAVSPPAANSEPSKPPQPSMGRAEAGSVHWLSRVSAFDALLAEQPGLGGAGSSGGAGGTKEIDAPCPVVELEPLVVAKSNPAQRGNAPPSANNSNKMGRPDFKRFRKNPILVSRRAGVEDLVESARVTAPEALQQLFMQIEQDEANALEEFNVPLANVKKKRPAAAAAARGAFGVKRRAATKPASCEDDSESDLSGL
jgi:hypothetical protein